VDPVLVGNSKKKKQKKKKQKKKIERIPGTDSRGASKAIVQ